MRCVLDVVNKLNIFEMLFLVWFFLSALLADSCSAVRVINRTEWGARDPVSTITLRTPVDLVFIHHTAGTRCGCDNYPVCKRVVKDIQNDHMDSTDRDWDDIGYNFLVGDDGFIYEGRGWNTIGAHTLRFNGKSIGLSFIGDFTSQTPSTDAIAAAKAMIADGVSRNLISSDYTLMGHRAARATACPGNELYNEIRSWDNFSNTVPADD